MILLWFLGQESTLISNSLCSEIFIKMALFLSACIGLTSNIMIFFYPICIIFLHIQQVMKKKIYFFQGFILVAIYCGRGQIWKNLIHGKYCALSVLNK